MAFETVGSWYNPVKCLVLFLFIRFEFTPINEYPFISFCVWQHERLLPYLHRTVEIRRNAMNCFRRVRKIVKAAVSFVMSVRPHGTNRLIQDGFP